MSTEGEADMEGAIREVAMTAHVGLHGAVMPFDVKMEEWNEYAERLELYFIANDIKDKGKKRAILLNGVGPATYRPIRTLMSPKKVTEFTYSQLVQTAAKHFNPKPTVIVKRYELNTRSQREGEMVANFVAALRKTAENFDFGTALNDMLRDGLVCGIASKSVQRRLLREATLINV